MEPLELRGADLSLRLADGSISGIPRGFDSVLLCS